MGLGAYWKRGQLLPGVRRWWLAVSILAAVGCRSPLFSRHIPADLRNEHADNPSLINEQTVNELALAWRIPRPDCVTHAPLVDGGNIYFADWGGVVTAADMRTGRLRWMSEAERPRNQRSWHGYCGTGAIGDGKLFEASAEGRAFAFRLREGGLLWQQRFTFHSDAGCRGNLLYWDHRLYIPVSTMEVPTNQAAASLFCGGVVALDSTDGHILWEQDLLTIGRQPDSGWVGLSVPSGFALDPQRGMLFLTTGQVPGGGPHLLRDSIVALDAKTGALKWAFPSQPASHKLAGPLVPTGGFAAAPQLFETRIEGKRRSLVAAGDKGGRFWVIDRDNGQLVWTSALGPGGPGGGIVADASIANGRVFLWSNRSYDYRAPGSHFMDIQALDSATGTVLWSDFRAQPAGYRSAGLLAGDVYLVGSLEGRIRAYRASDGRNIWTSVATGPVSSALVAEDGYLFLSTGIPQSLGGNEAGGAVLCFALSFRDNAP